MTAKRADTVALPRAEYEALLRRIEDAEDLASVAERVAREQAMGKVVARADYLPIAMIQRMIDGESPVRIWREHRGLTGAALAAAAGIPAGYLSEIETGKKPGSLAAMAKIARALGISIDDIAPVS